jgi:hypothetical protein
MNERADYLTGLRPGEVIALTEIAPELAQRAELHSVLDPFGQYREPEGVRERHDRADNRRVLGVGAEARDERTVDLQSVHRENLEIPERRLTSSEVVDADPHTVPGERPEHVDGMVGVMHEIALVDLEHEL